MATDLAHIRYKFIQDLNEYVFSANMDVLLFGGAVRDFLLHGHNVRNKFDDKVVPVDLDYLCQSVEEYNFLIHHLEHYDIKPSSISIQENEAIIYPEKMNITSFTFKFPLHPIKVKIDLVLYTEDAVWKGDYLIDVCSLTMNSKGSIGLVPWYVDICSDRSQLITKTLSQANRVAEILQSIYERCFSISVPLSNPRESVVKMKIITLMARNWTFLHLKHKFTLNEKGMILKNQEDEPLIQAAFFKTIEL